MKRLRGVKSSGVIWQTSVSATTDAEVFTTRATSQIPVLAASSGIFRSVSATFSQGQAFTQLSDSRKFSEVVLGVSAARSLGVQNLKGQASVLISGIPFVVVGIIAKDSYEPSLLDSAVIPDLTALRLWGASDSGSQMDVAVRAGFAQSVADEAPYALLPSDPSRLSVVTNPVPLDLQNQIEGDLSGLLTVIGIVTLFVGGVGIAGASMNSVLGRVSEIGLRRALGARKRHIAFQFLCESAFLGLLGGIAGTWLALFAIIFLAHVHNWTPIINPLVMGVAPIVGAIEGGVAGLYPALRASRMNPVDSLRR
jgi:putative ABC transport system permease protein